MCIDEAGYDDSVAELLLVSVRKSGSYVPLCTNLKYEIVANQDCAVVDRLGGDWQNPARGKKFRSRRLVRHLSLTGATISLEVSVASHDRSYVSARRRKVDALDEVITRQRRRPGCSAVPFDGSAWTGIVGGNHSDFRVRQIAEASVNLLQIPATNLNVTLRISQHTLRIISHLSLELTHAGFGRPLSTDGGRDLHQSDLAVFAMFPRTEVGFLVNDAPNEIRVKMIDVGLSLD